ncbi:MAG: hypothetical protein LQ341_000483 [Variospora aurantia]|nr:MAG: hypothetical protein LQ341_000483 [Variospora aurantia]
MLSRYLLFVVGFCALLTPSVAGITKFKTWCSADESTATPVDWATPGFQASMLYCMGRMNNNGWLGYLCDPVYNDDFNLTDPNPHHKFGFWKSHSGNFKDAKDCYIQCAPCLERGIRAGLVNTEQVECDYEVKRVRSHTCEMGFDRLPNDTNRDWAFHEAGMEVPEGYWEQSTLN